jgi:hypothetical protein
MRVVVENEWPELAHKLPSKMIEPGFGGCSQALLYNTVHPHRALSYRSPREFIASRSNRENMSDL